MIEVQWAEDSAERAQQWVSIAFDGQHKYHKQAHRRMGSVLALATQRGYGDKTHFRDYFSSATPEAPHAKRLIQQLFEFVSPEEVLELMQLPHSG